MIFDPFITELLSSSIDPILYMGGYLYKENTTSKIIEEFSDDQKIINLYNVLPSVSLQLNENYKTDVLINLIFQESFYENLFQSIITNVTPDKKFKHLQFNSLELLNEKESENSSVGLTAEIKPFYNFYSKKYEEFLLNVTGTVSSEYELSLPNFYSLNNCLINSASSNDLYQISLNGNLNLNTLRVNLDSYYEDYADGFRPIDFYNKNLKFKTVILPDSSDQFYRNLKLEKEDVPFGVEISFDGFEQNSFTEFLIQDGYYCTVAKNIDAISDFNVTSSFYQNKTIFNLAETVNEDGTTTIQLATTNTYESSSLFSVLYTASDSYTSVISFDTATAKLIDYDPSNQFSVRFTDCTQPTDFSSILNFYLSKAKIEEQSEQLKISYTDVINKTINNSKPILFVVEKFRDNKLVQKFYVPNMGRNNFIDSQINFGIKYKYVISSYSLVGKLEYFYNSFERIGTKLIYGIKSNITENKLIQLVKNEIFTKEVIVYDNPPLAPDVQFYPIINSNSNNLVQFFLNAPVGQVEQVPVFINSFLDKQLISKSIESQNVLEGQKLLFSTDDPPYGFFVHKKKIVPTSYEDFINSTSTLVFADLNSYSKNIIDSLEFNTKYYYCFRTVDIHRQISNPSPIYEIEIVEDKGNFYPVIKLFPLEPQKEKFNSITFKKYIHIMPSIVQTTINEVKSDLLDASTAFDKNIILGPDDNRVWDKKFKLRLKSKTTGKIIDFNLTFNKSHFITEDEKNRVIT